MIDINAAYVKGGVTVQVAFNDFAYNPVPTTFNIKDETGSTGRQQAVFDAFNSNPNSQLSVYAVNMQVDISWTNDYTLPFGSSLPEPLPVIYGWEPSYLAKPEISQARPTDWDDGGYPGAKFLQEFIVHTDTFGQPKSVHVETDSNAQAQGSPVIGPQIIINIDGEAEAPYSLDPSQAPLTNPSLAMSGPMLCHLMRIVPDDETPWRLFGITWVFEPAPEMVNTWTTQATNHDLAGFHHHRDGYIALAASYPVTLTLSLDGKNPVAQDQYPIAPNPYVVRTYIVFRAAKSKYTQYSLNGGPFRLYQKDCEVRVKSWGDPGGYQIKKPFGGDSRRIGAAI
jgi:hypothetical protein